MPPRQKTPPRPGMETIARAKEHGRARTRGPPAPGWVRRGNSRGSEASMLSLRRERCRRVSGG
eukprot:9358967-Alexandrium_andersonii.AAC.1